MKHTEYPRPQLQREKGSWQILNGEWGYKVIKGNHLDSDYEKIYEELKFKDGIIEVPFSMETELSGVGKQLKPDETLLMMKVFNKEVKENGKYILHFGAVDQKCRIWLNGSEMGYHEDGYLPFSFDITASIKQSENELVIAIVDESDQSYLPWGKQKLERQQIWYTAQSGIWQTVWLECIPEDYIEKVNFVYDGTSGVNVNLSKTGDKNIILTIFEPTLAGMYNPDFLSGTYKPIKVQEIINGSKVEIDTVKKWSPEEPWLYPVKLEYGEDVVFTYTGLRTIGIKEDNSSIKKMTLNEDIYFQTGVLDQGYYKDGLYTPADEETVIDELKMLKSMGFNMVRKHIKIEPYRWYFHCDRLGLIVWQDMVSGGSKYNPLYIQILPFIGIHLSDKKYGRFGRNDKKSREAAVRHQTEVIKNLEFFPSIGMWVISNEGWGQFDSVDLAMAAKKQDPTRVVDHASGWHDQKGPDFNSPHVYYKPIKLKYDGRPIILSEFGGYSYPVPGHTPEKPFGYRMYKDRKSYNSAVSELYLKQILPYKNILSGIVYTQLSDVEDEVNGLVTFDRQIVKWDPSALKELNEKLK
ncbi:MAG: glycoside hydrolase family 2 TIM barrel-domain containing protein [Clostridiaceae bacterium]